MHPTPTRDSSRPSPLTTSTPRERAIAPAPFDRSSS
jgi:hypothetical protein